MCVHWRENILLLQDSSCAWRKLFTQWAQHTQLWLKSSALLLTIPNTLSRSNKATFHFLSRPPYACSCMLTKNQNIDTRPRTPKHGKHNPHPVSKKEWERPKKSRKQGNQCLLGRGRDTPWSWPSSRKLFSKGCNFFQNWAGKVTVLWSKNWSCSACGVTSDFFSTSFPLS